MITVERLRELLHYDRATGLFTWLVTRGRSAKKGSIAGSVAKKGYIVIGVDGRNYPAHVLAWLYCYGVWPVGDLDHRDMVHANNRIDNLRPASRSQNMANIGPHADNTSGFKGVQFDKRRNCWIAIIMKDGKRFWLGSHSSPEIAHEAYTTAAKRLFGEYARAAA